MQTYLNWLKILLKSQLKKPSFYGLLLAMVLLVGLIHICTLPKEENTKVLLCYEELEKEDRELAFRICKRLEQMDSIYEFKLVEDEEQVRTSVLAGKALCGFVFQEGIYRKSVENRPRHIIAQYSASFANTKEIAKETVYAAFFAEYSTIILEGHVEDIYKYPSEELTEELLATAKKYLDGEELFRVEKEGYEKSGEAALFAKEQVYPVKGSIGLIIFLGIFLTCGQGMDPFQKYLPRRQGWIYQFIKCLSIALPLCILGLVLLAGFTEMKEGPGEILDMVVLVLTGYLLSVFFGKVCKRKERYNAIVFSLLLLNLTVCPIFLELSLLIPGLRYLRLLFPVGIYLL